MGNRYYHNEKLRGGMKVSERCGTVASKNNRIRRLINRNITYMEKGLIIHLYKTIIKPHLQYCITRLDNIA